MPFAVKLWIIILAIITIRMSLIKLTLAMFKSQFVLYQLIIEIIFKNSYINIFNFKINCCKNS